jgi:hypothetical protein
VEQNDLCQKCLGHNTTYRYISYRITIVFMQQQSRITGVVGYERNDETQVRNVELFSSFLAENKDLQVFFGLSRVGLMRSWRCYSGNESTRTHSTC